MKKEITLNFGHSTYSVTARDWVNLFIFVGKTWEAIEKVSLWESRKIYGWFWSWMQCSRNEKDEQTTV